jgi:hypothetical protein
MSIYDGMMVLARDGAALDGLPDGLTNAVRWRRPFRYYTTTGSPGSNVTSSI